MLQHYADCRLLHEAGNGIEAVELAAELKPQLVLLDLNIPHLSGIRAATQIAQLSPDSAILFVSMNHSVNVVSEALRAGAKGFVLKTDAGRDLWPAIEAVLQNKQFLSRSLRGAHSVTIQ
jgi:DNA-binding NarL/FixJ family response regulator